jgi:hypothetical protein
VPIFLQATTSQNGKNLPRSSRRLTWQLIDSGNRISDEIAARMMVQDYPGSATAKDCLARVLEMGVVVEAVNVT